MHPALAIWQAGVDAVGGFAATRRALESVRRPDQILAVGKAAGAMARAAAATFDDVPTVVVTKDGHGDGLPGSARLLEAAHPVPDHRSLAAGAALRAAVGAMPGGSNLLLLVSGGASSLAEDLVDGFDLSDLAALNSRLLGAGLDITAMNAERRKLSRIKGGGLLSGFKGAGVQVLAISDVPGDDLKVIGSGIGACPAGAGFAFTAQIIASNAIARNAAQAEAQRQNLPVHANSESLHDDIDQLVPVIANQLLTMPKGVLILGGEPTVHLPPNPGEGGRNQALALALAGEIQGRDDLTVMVGGTDGSDGPTDAAGALVTGATWGEGATNALRCADAGRYLETKGARIKTGPTGTNVMDLLIGMRS